MERTTSIYAQGSISEYENDGDTQDRYYLPARALSFKAKDPKGLVVLPDDDNGLVRGYHQQLKAVFQSINQVYGAEPVFVPDSSYFLDESITGILRNYMVGNPITSRLRKDISYKVYPYACTEKCQTWINDLKDQGFTIDSFLPQKIYYDDLRHPAHRGGWGWSVGEGDFLPPRISNLPYPDSWIGWGLNGVVEAYQNLVDRTGSEEAFFKPLFSAGGFTIKRIGNSQELAEHYLLMKEQGALNILNQETPVEIQQSVGEISGLYSLQYSGTHIESPGFLTRQLVSGTQWVGNIFNCGVEDRFVKQGRSIFTDFCREYKIATGNSPTGWGGIDLAVVQNGVGPKMIILEHNGQRITGANPAIVLAEGLGVEGPYMILKTPAEVNCDLRNLWEEIKGLGCDFDQNTKRGVMPIVWMEGSGMLWIADQDEYQMRKKLDRVYNTLLDKDLIK